MNATIQKRGELATGYLTQREVEILAMVAAGFLSKQIAVLLGGSPSSVKKHRDNLCRKLDAHCGADLTRKAIGLGVLPVDVTPMRRHVSGKRVRYLIP